MLWAQAWECINFKYLKSPFNVKGLFCIKNKKTIDNAKTLCYYVKCNFDQIKREYILQDVDADLCQTDYVLVKKYITPPASYF